MVRQWLEKWNHWEVRTQVRMEVEDLYLTPRFFYVADGDNGTRAEKKRLKFGEAGAGVWNSKVNSGIVNSERGWGDALIRSDSQVSPCLDCRTTRTGAGA